MAEAINSWRIAGDGFFEETVTAPARPVQDAIENTQELLNVVLPNLGGEPVDPKRPVTSWHKDCPQLLDTLRRDVLQLDLLTQYRSKHSMTGKA